MTIVDRQGNKI
jgi:hypothetical protein